MCPDPNQDGFIEEDRHKYTDFKSVESQRNDLIAEEFPEGPYGSSKMTESLGKSTPWRESQRPPNRFAYENQELHEGIYRDYPAEDDKYVDRDE
jgi:hypothetical protein